MSKIRFSSKLEELIRGLASRLKDKPIDLSSYDIKYNPECFEIEIICYEGSIPAYIFAEICEYMSENGLPLKEIYADKRGFLHIVFYAFGLAS